VQLTARARWRAPKVWPKADLRSGANQTLAVAQSRAWRLHFRSGGAAVAPADKCNRERDYAHLPALATCRTKGSIFGPNVRPFVFITVPLTQSRAAAQLVQLARRPDQLGPQLTAHNEGRKLIPVGELVRHLGAVQLCVARTLWTDTRELNRRKFAGELKLRARQKLSRACPC